LNIILQEIKVPKRLRQRKIQRVSALLGLRWKIREVKSWYYLDKIFYYINYILYTITIYRIRSQISSLVT